MLSLRSVCLHCASRNSFHDMLYLDTYVYNCIGVMYAQSKYLTPDSNINYAIVSYIRASYIQIRLNKHTFGVSRGHSQQVELIKNLTSNKYCKYVMDGYLLVRITKTYLQNSLKCGTVL